MALVSSACLHKSSQSLVLNLKDFLQNRFIIQGLSNLLILPYIPQKGQEFKQHTKLLLVTPDRLLNTEPNLKSETPKTALNRPQIIERTQVEPPDSKSALTRSSALKAELVLIRLWKELSGHFPSPLLHKATLIKVQAWPSPLGWRPTCTQNWIDEGLQYEKITCQQLHEALHIFCAFSGVLQNASCLIAWRLSLYHLEYRENVSESRHTLVLLRLISSKVCLPSLIGRDDDWMLHNYPPNAVLSVFLPS